MPDPTRREVPTGQPYGQAGEQQAFLDATDPVVERAQAQQAQAASPAPQIQRNTLPPFVEPDQQVDDDDPDGQYVVDLDGVGPVDLTALAMADTARPDESVTAGLPGARTQRSVSDVLASALRRAGVAAPDVVALADEARRLGL